MNYEAIDALRDAIAAAGLTPPAEILADGELHRFASNGKHGDDSGWYVAHLDGMPAGAFGCWRTGVNETWAHRNGRVYTPTERAEQRRRIDEAQRLHAREQSRRHDEAAKRVDRLWADSRPAEPGHAYLRRKSVGPHGIRQIGDELLIPVRIGGALRSVQKIKPDGTKRFLKGGEVVGGYFSIGGNPESTLLVCEGFATAASLHEATGYPVVVAFNAGNLEAVARALRAKYPGAKLLICADDDYRTAGNPGMAKAAAAARAVGGLLAVPDFGEDRPDGATDFNDLARHRGAEAVSAAIARARAPGDAGQGQGVEAGREAVVVRVADVQPEPIAWLWPGRIALGKLSLLSGDPGLGKSLVSLALAAHVTRGRLWPVDRAACPLGDVLLLSAEDDISDTIRPRLEAAGADLTRVHAVQSIRDTDSDGTPIVRGVSLRRDLLTLDALLAERPAVRLVVIDPVSAYLGDTDSHNNAEVRGLLAPVAELAARQRVAILAVTHLNKSAGPAMYRTSGSLAFVAAARATFGVVKDKDDPVRRLVLPIKNNLGPDASGLAYRVIAGLNGAPLVDWEPDPVTISADEAMGPAARDDERTATDEAADWLRDLLAASGPMRATEVQKEARAAGISDKALRMGRERLGVSPKKEGGHFGMGGQRWIWRLPAEDALNAEDALPSGQGTFKDAGHLQDGEAFDEGEI